MSGETYEYSKGDVALFLERVDFQLRNVCNNVSCFGRTRDVMDKLNLDGVGLVCEGGRELNIWVHGIFQNYHRFLRCTVEWFLERGIVVIPVGYDYFSSVEESADRIGSEIDDLMRRAGVKKINLIGVSYGGGVARHYLEYLGGAEKVDKFISVCVPYSALKRKNLAYWMGKLIGEDNNIEDGIFYENSCRNHFAIHALKDKIIGKQEIFCDGVCRAFVRGGHNPSSNDPRKLELILKILKGEVS